MIYKWISHDNIDLLYDAEDMRCMLGQIRQLREPMGNDILECRAFFPNTEQREHHIMHDFAKGRDEARTWVESNHGFVER